MMGGTDPDNCAGTYKEYLSVNQNGYTVFASEDLMRIIFNNGDGWTITSYAYYPLFECDCYDGDEAFHSSTNGDVQIDASEWAHYSISLQ